ncbi:MAG: hypothetical protein JNM14_02265 [Ferruginibacter sp.]|nr:hypothetical protein [Ferruginibacter sp.]
MRIFFKIFFIFAFLSTPKLTLGQLKVTGTVFDSSRTNYVENVRVETTSGRSVKTDSMGRYQIIVNEKDSLTFIYQSRPTQKFPVKNIADLTQFDISIGVRVKSGYRTLKEVLIFARSYKEDSIENRRTYAAAFNYRKPTIRTSVSPSGAAGADVNEIINMFRFGRNKRMKAFQARVEQQEQDNFVRYRFNRNFVRRITQLQGAELDTFMVRYLPAYEFAVLADEVTFNKYILISSYAFKIELLKKVKTEAKKEN